MSFSKKRRGAVAWWALGALGVVGAGAAVGYKVLFNRPGEQAIAYLPADSQAVLTVDLRPSTQQATTFEEIRKALAEEGLLDKLEQGLSAAADKDKIIGELRPHIQTSFALGAWDIKDGREPGGVAVLIAVDDGNAVASILSSKLRGYKLDGAQAFVIDKNGTAAVIDNYLVFGNNEAAVKKVLATRAHRLKSVAEVAEYTEARKALPEDANAMLFVSSSALKDAGDKAARELAAANPFEKAGWFSVGLTVRAEGLLCSFRSPFEASAIPEMEPLGKLPALNMKALALMPDGAYGLAMLSQPSALFKVIQGFAARQEKSRREMEEGIAKIQSETGFDIERDVLPAFQGEVTVALYPGQGKDPEALFVLDTSNGATPAEFAQKFEDALRSGRFDKDKAAPQIQTESYKGSDIKWFSADGKQPGYVTVNGNVFASTSVDLLRKAVDTANGGSPLAENSRYHKMLAHNVKGSRMAVLIDLPSILAQATKDGGGPTWDWQQVLGDDGAVVSASYDGKKATGEIFVPVNWVEAIHRIGEEAKKQDQQSHERSF